MQNNFGSIFHSAPRPTSLSARSCNQYDCLTISFYLFFVFHFITCFLSFIHCKRYCCFFICRMLLPKACYPLLHAIHYFHWIVAGILLWFFFSVNLIHCCCIPCCCSLFESSSYKLADDAMLRVVGYRWTKQRSRKLKTTDNKAKRGTD